jgi:hypothetical protein
MINWLRESFSLVQTDPRVNNPKCIHAMPGKSDPAYQLDSRPDRSHIRVSCYFAEHFLYTSAILPASSKGVVFAAEVVQPCRVSYHRISLLIESSRAIRSRQANHSKGFDLATVGSGSLHCIEHR